MSMLEDHTYEVFVEAVDDKPIKFIVKNKLDMDMMIQMYTSKKFIGFQGGENRQILINIDNVIAIQITELEEEQNAN